MKGEEWGRERERKREKEGEREKGCLSERGDRKRKPGSEATSRKGVGMACLLKRQNNGYNYSHLV